MQLIDILKIYARQPAVAGLIAPISQNSQSRIKLNNVNGSLKAFVMAAVVEKTQGSHLVIVSDREEAAFFLNDIENLLGDNSALYYPASYKKAYDVEDIDNANVLLRAEALNKINNAPNPLVIVTYPEALLEKVVTRSQLTTNTLKVTINTKLSIDFVSELLFEYSFERVDFVYEPGQFSVRGGIVDIFSFSNNLPYRVEFFGDDVESIRTFNPETQLSVEPLVSINIIPNIQNSALMQTRESFLNYIPADTTIWTESYSYATQIVKGEFEKAEKIYAELNQTLKHAKPDELYLTQKEFEAQTQNRNIVEFGPNSHFPSAQKVNFNSSPQPHFNKNFDLLAKQMLENADLGYKNYILADTPKQIERIYAIFEDGNLRLRLAKQLDRVEVQIPFSPIYTGIHAGFTDHDQRIACFAEHQIFDRYQRFKLKKGFQKAESITLKDLYDLKNGDFVTHIDYGVGRFSGLEKIEVNGKMQEAIRLVYKDNDILYASVHSLHKIAKYTGKEGHEPKLNKLGSPAWAALKHKTKAKVKDIAKDLIKLYAKRKTEKGFQFSPDTYMQTELEASFIYEDTPDQIKSNADVKHDMESASPMDRLICGDVGFGKTEVAIRAAFKAVADGKQVAILVPTTILAYQHAKTFSARLKNFPCTVDYINRFKTAAQQKETLQKLADGKVDIIIGTHRLLSKDIKFKDLGLMIVDEEQKFGVAAKEKLKAMKLNVDTLTLTATPIPRTLQFSMMGARDLSVIRTPPPNRYPVQTEIHTFNEELIRDAVSYELSRGGQVFMINNRIENIHEIANKITRLVPEAKVAIGHGQMDGDKLEDIMLGFMDGAYDVLVATTIIESGLDIPNANTIIINNAHMFGLSDLHQMRGRVGRSNKKAFCYLLTMPVMQLTDEARKRLRALEEFSDLGSGFNIAMRDLDIRGAGNLLGGEQSGFISDIGFETYTRILDEAIQELKEGEFYEVFHQEEAATQGDNNKLLTFLNDCAIDTDLEILIPDEYVNSTAERLSLYKDLDNTKNEEELLLFEKGLVDRFGPYPQPVKELLDTIRLRRLAVSAGFERLVMKSGKMIAYFISKPNSPYYQSPVFMKILQYIQTHPTVGTMKQTNDKLSLSIANIKNVQQALALVNRMME